MPEISDLQNLPAGAVGFAPVSVMVNGVPTLFLAALVAPADFAALRARVAALELAGAASPTPTPGTTPGTTPSGGTGATFTGVAMLNQDGTVVLNPDGSIALAPAGV